MMGQSTVQALFFFNDRLEGRSLRCQHFAIISMFSDASEYSGWKTLHYGSLVNMTSVKLFRLKEREKQRGRWGNIFIVALM